MTIFAICMTALAAFLLGLNLGKMEHKSKKGGKKSQKAEKKMPAHLTSEEYLNFLSYDGSEQA